MPQYLLKNESMEMVVSSHGAELRSLKYQGMEYLWQADAAYWGRTAPILFPFVGSTRGKEYRHKGVAYSMTQHGFARDMEFQLTQETGDSMTFVLQDTVESRKKYPFSFHLQVQYTLKEKGVEIAWQVQNTGAETMPFSIGAHPAFQCPLYEGEHREDYSLAFYRQGKQLTKLRNTLLNPEGLATDRHVVMDLPDGRLYVTKHLFDGDALVIEGEQADQVSILDAAGREYVRVSFPMPLFGIWSPSGKQAPFVCIEPWYGRCDNENFTGELKEREYTQCLNSGECFAAAYQIAVG